MFRTRTVLVGMTMMGLLALPLGAAQSAVVSVTETVLSDADGQTHGPFGFVEFENPTSFAVLNSTDALQIYHERQNIFSGSGVTDSDPDIAPGVSFSSFLFHWDPSSGAKHGKWTINFSTNILGVVWDDNELDNTDGFAKPGMALGNIALNATRGLEILGVTTSNPDIADSFSFSGSSIEVELRSGLTGIDQFRVLTEVTAIPVPAALPLLVSAIAGLMFLRRRGSAAL